MSGYVGYSEYRDSEVEWIGDVPSGWSVLPLKYKSTCNDDVLPDFIDGFAEFKYVDIGSVSLTEGIFTIEDLQYKDAPSRARRRVRHGDVIVSTVRTYLSAISLINNPPENMIVSTGFAVIRPSRNLSSRFAAYCATSPGFIGQVVSRSVGVSYPAINATDLVSLEIPIPCVKEQNNIENFLDYETAKIDTLIEKQQQLIKLLKEKRQAVISHAVTKGLNPDAPMKDSGVEWLGEVPEHWDISPMKYSVRSIEQGWSPQCSSSPANEREYGVLKVGCVNTGEFNANENKALPASLQPQIQYVLKKDDLLVSRANTKELVGSAAVVERDYDFLLLCDKLYRIRFKNGSSSRFVSYFLATPGARLQIEIGASGASSSMQNIGQATILELEVPNVPLSELNQIMEYLANTISTLRDTETKILKQLALLKERRTALISAAVTGKIDVRNWQPPADSSTPSMDA